MDDILEEIKRKLPHLSLWDAEVIKSIFQKHLENQITRKSQKRQLPKICPSLSELDFIPPGSFPASPKRTVKRKKFNQG